MRSNNETVQVLANYIFELLMYLLTFWATVKAYPLAHEAIVRSDNYSYDTSNVSFDLFRALLRFTPLNMRP